MGGVKIVKVCWIPFRGGVWVLNTTFWQIGDLQTGTQTQLLIYILRVSHSAKPLGWCSTVETTKQRLGDLRHHLKRRRYNGKVIESGFSKVSEINRNNLLEYKEKKINKRIPLVLTLSNIIPSLFRENFRHRPFHHWKEIEKSETLAKFFPEQSVVAFRRPKSIKDTVVRDAVFRPSSTVGQCKPCGDKRCKCCLQLQHAQVFHSKPTGKE